MKFIISAFIYLFYTTIFSQSIIVSYKTSVFDFIRKDDKIMLYEDNELIASSKFSIYKSNSRDTIVNFDDHTFNSVRDTSSVEFIFRDLTKNEISQTKLAPKHMVVKENINFNWIIGEKTKDFLGYKTQEASCVFRGRKIIAYFCKDIPIASGPFKFGGLPGLILEIYSEDATVSIKAISVKQNKETIEIKNPFENLKTVTWAYYCSEFKKFADKLARFSTGNEGGVTISNKGIELTD